MNLYEKIINVMKDVQYLQKDDKVETGKSGKTYKAITEEKVTSIVRESLIKHGIAIIPIDMQTKVNSEVIGERINRLTHIDVKYRIVNTEDPADFIEAVSSGTGVDTQDKGIGKAMTYAYKYLLLRTFAIPTGEDADMISSEAYTEKLMDAVANDEAEKQKLRDIILMLAKNDADRVDSYLSKKFGKTLYECTLAQLKTAKLDIARKVEHESA